MKARIVLIGAVCVLLACVSAASAAVNIDTVAIGNPGNADDDEVMVTDSTTGYGAVSYAYNVGKFEVTAGQYTEFLNAVAATDTYSLYKTSMDSNILGCQITRLGSSGSYTYSVAVDWMNRPVNYVSWGDAARFANWLHNDQPTGTQDNSTTEDGAYYLNGAISDAALLTVNRETDWKWAIPSEDEWYKAAYHKSDGVTGNYFDQATSSDTTPSNDLIVPDPGNNVTFWEGGSDYTIGNPYYRTEVGAHENSERPYGTFDQAGNVYEWNEAILDESNEMILDESKRGIRGGGYGSGTGNLPAWHRSYGSPTFQGAGFGFRVVQVPEPATLGLLIMGGLALLCRKA